ncbi:hypothetical protein UPYG_G00058650, partial [Umbra pygmaea]
MATPPQLPSTSQDHPVFVNRFPVANRGKDLRQMGLLQEKDSDFVYSPPISQSSSYSPTCPSAARLAQSIERETGASGNVIQLSTNDLDGKILPIPLVSLPGLDALNVNTKDSITAIPLP